MELSGFKLLLGFAQVIMSNAQEGDKFFSPVFVKQDFGIDRSWELNLLAKGYSLYTGIGYYKLYRQSLAWGKAWAKCDSDGAHLLILNSESEVDAVKNLVTVNTTPSAFAFIIGFHDYFVEGTYLTVKGEHLWSTGYVKWGTGQPDNWKGEHCGAMRRDGTLADVACSSDMYFICEHEL
ncbi:hypothetical protein L9F63_017830 [Diploptera punctata]|uniref:C-type lectin domain-containing protein n=1 Tax=Diploptera punctata TaxID=6984 RepID=A0AAD7ZXS1_DIPPU|nr:hypothetical protein L9F63_017830 [Diploptera punctata]